MTPPAAKAGDPVTGTGDRRTPLLVTLGETMGLIAQRTVGSLAHADGLTLGIGGAEGNVAIGVRRLGCRATWFGRVGRDDVGDLIAREFRAEGVDARIVRDDAPTGLMLKTRRTAWATRVTYYRRGQAGAHLCADDLDPDVIRSAAVLHVTGITPALGAGPAAAVRAAIDIARGASVPVSLDLNYRSALWDADTAGAALRELARSADIVFAGDDEARLVVTGDGPEELAAGLTRLGPRQAIIKLGARGAWALVDGVGLAQPVVPVDAVDTVGAGDAFVAGYLAELMRGAPATRRLATAATAGACVAASPGDWEGLPTRADLEGVAATDPVIR